MRKNQVSQEHPGQDNRVCKTLDCEGPGTRIRVAGSEVGNLTSFPVGKSLPFI